MNRTTALAIVVVAVVVAAPVMAILYFPDSSGGRAAVPEPVTIGVQPVESSALLYIAQDRGFFEKNGLAVTMRDFDPPALGVSALVRGDVDLASSTEYPVVLHAFRGEPVSVIATHVKVQGISLVGRKDRGIANISDLRGKRIGVPRGTILDFYLGRFLALHGMDLRDVTLADVRPEQFADAIAGGGIDALVCYEPYTTAIRSRMGDAIAEWPGNSGEPSFGVVSARRDWIARNPDRVARFLKSLDMASEYTASHPAGARAIVQRRLNLSDAYLEAMWQKNRFGLSLDQSLVLAMEDEARWMIANNVTNAGGVPDLEGYVYPDALRDLEPGSVHIIR